MDVRLHELKARSPISVTLLGISIVFKLLQEPKAELPITFTPKGIIIEVRPWQS